MQKLLLVSPHFPPTNAADMQRVRQSLPYWHELGWSPEIVAVEPQQVDAPEDPFLLQTIPPNIPIHRVRALSLGWSKVPGMGTLGYRAIRALRRKIHQLLAGVKAERPWSIYFSTTQFPVLHLIPEIKQRWPATIVMVDYQDPWVSDYYRLNPQSPPPGGKLKYALVQAAARRHEPRVLRNCNAITAVSAEYLVQLNRRYSWLSETPQFTIPFAATENDFTSLESSDIRQKIFDPADGMEHWVHVGRGGNDMMIPVQGVMRALAKARAHDLGWNRIRLHFIGTSYAPAQRAQPVFLSMAADEGIADLVSEHPARLPYGQALRCMKDASALFVPGSLDEAYSPSKIYPCILARKPILAVFQAKSPMKEVFATTNAATSVLFDQHESIDKLADRIHDAWMRNDALRQSSNTDWDAFKKFGAQAMTQRLSVALDRAGQHAARSQ